MDGFEKCRRPSRSQREKQVTEKTVQEAPECVCRMQWAARRRNEANKGPGITDTVNLAATYLEKPWRISVQLTQIFYK